PDRSERIARLKAASRLLVHTIGDWVIVTAKIGAYEASACRGLIDLGADVAIVGGKPAKDVVRISARSTNEFYQETGINLGTDIMEPLGELIDGKGGGHPNAAGANGTRNRKKALLQSVELIRKILEQNSSTQTQGG
ncbi:MAG: DHH family phosphoesterase, partial [Candidatus Thorarchaeota archaeon]